MCNYEVGIRVSTYVILLIASCGNWLPLIQGNPTKWDQLRCWQLILVGRRLSAPLRTQRISLCNLRYAQAESNKALINFHPVGSRAVDGSCPVKISQAVRCRNWPDLYGRTRHRCDHLVAARGQNRGCIPRFEQSCYRARGAN
jgi:hypothetical protein